jgi:hypothetical protein
MAIDRDVAAVAELLAARYGSRARVYAAHRAAKLRTPRDARQLYWPGDDDDDDYAMPDGRPLL